MVGTSLPALASDAHTSQRCCRAPARAYRPAHGPDLRHLVTDVRAGWDAPIARPVHALPARSRRDAELADLKATCRRPVTNGRYRNASTG